MPSVKLSGARTAKGLGVIVIELKLPDRGRLFRTVNRIVAFTMLVTSVVTVVGLFSLRDSLVHIELEKLPSWVERARENWTLRENETQSLLVNAADRIIDSRGKVLLYACGPAIVSINGMIPVSDERAVSGCTGFTTTKALLPGQALEIQPAKDVSFISGEYKVIEAPMFMRGARLAYVGVSGLIPFLLILVGLAVCFIEDDWAMLACRGLLISGILLSGPMLVLMPFLPPPGSVGFIPTAFLAIIGMMSLAVLIPSASGFGYLALRSRAASDKEVAAFLQTSKVAKLLAVAVAGSVVLPIAIFGLLLAWQGVFQLAAIISDFVLPNWVGITMRILFSWTLW